MKQNVFFGLLVLSLFSLSGVVQAQNMAKQESIVKYDIEKVDTTKYCVYGREIYTQGAILELKNNLLKCVHTTSSRNSDLEWAIVR